MRQYENQIQSSNSNLFSTDGYQSYLWAFLSQLSIYSVAVFFYAYYMICACIQDHIVCQQSNAYFKKAGVYCCVSVCTWYMCVGMCHSVCVCGGQRTILWNQFSLTSHGPWKSNSHCQGHPLLTEPSHGSTYFLNDVCLVICVLCLCACTCMQRGRKRASVFSSITLFVPLKQAFHQVGSQQENPSNPPVSALLGALRSLAFAGIPGMLHACWNQNSVH